MSVFSFISELFWNTSCFGCKASGKYICENCRQKIQIYEPYCYVCKKHSPGFFIHPPCQKVFPLQQVIVLTHYRENAIKKLLRHAKFYHKHQAYKSIILPYKEFFTNYISTNNSILVPLPMNILRRWKRGYNQTDKITQALSQIIDLPVYNKLISRKYSWKQQSHLSRNERFENIKGAFKPHSHNLSKDMTIYLVDDVVSTGWTLTEAAKTLAEAGFTDIRAVVLASD